MLLVILCCACAAGCTAPLAPSPQVESDSPSTSKALDYYCTLPDREEELLYLYPFLAIHKWSQIVQRKEAVTDGDAPSVRWVSQTNRVFDIVRAEWAAAERTDRLPVRIDAMLVRDVESIARNPDVPILVGRGCRPDEYEANPFLQAPSARFFYMTSDRLVFLDKEDKDALANEFEALRPVQEMFDVWKVQAPRRTD